MLVFEGLHINSAKLIKKLRTAKKIWNLISKLIAQTRLIHLGSPVGGMITLSGRVAEDAGESGGYGRNDWVGFAGISTKR